MCTIGMYAVLYMCDWVPNYCELTVDISGSLHIGVSLGMTNYKPFLVLSLALQKFPLLLICVYMETSKNSIYSTRAVYSNHVPLVKQSLGVVGINLITFLWMFFSFTVVIKKRE